MRRNCLSKPLDITAAGLLTLLGLDLLYLATVQIIELGTGQPLHSWVHLYMTFLRFGAASILAVVAVAGMAVRPLRRAAAQRHRRAVVVAGPLLAADIVLQITAGLTPGAVDRPSHRARAAALLEADRPLIVGHAGSKTQCPENTLPCYRLALNRGAQALEADLRVLADGTLVMFHDPDTKRVTGAPYRLHRIDRSMLKRLDAGWGFTPDAGESHPWRGHGVHIPTLGEFLETFPDTPVLLDVKDGSEQMERSLERFLRRELDPVDRRRLFIKPNHDALARELRRLRPRVHVALTHAERARLGFALRLGLHWDRIPRFRPSWIDINVHNIPNASYVLARMARWAEARGHLLTASTVDRRAEMTELLSLPGIGGLVTNRPARMRAVIGRGREMLADRAEAGDGR